MTPEDTERWDSLREKVKAHGLRNSLMIAIAPTATIAAIAVQGAGFIVWVVVVSRVKLGVAFAISGGSFYMLMAAASWLVYGERLNPWQWGGLVMISIGVMMVSLLGQNP